MVRKPHSVSNSLSEVIVEQFVTFDSHEAFSLASAEQILRCAQRSIEERDSFYLVLSGGSTPGRTYEVLAEKGSDLDWTKVFLFFGDDRIVPPDHEWSNRKKPDQVLISKVPIPADHVLYIPTHLSPQSHNATAYEQQLRNIFPDVVFPRFDLVLLGMGPDGHTASLFPGRSSLQEQKAWAVYEPDPGLPPKVGRVTLTLPVINHARTVLFLVSGANKQEVLDDLRSDRERSEKNYPVSLVQPVQGALIWHFTQ